METTNTAIKRKSRLAVFELVQQTGRPKHKKFRLNRFTDDDSSPSESELVIDDEANSRKKKRKAMSKKVRLCEELMSLKCDWNDCEEMFADYKQFNNHLNEHVHDFKKLDQTYCKWNGCPNANDTFTGPLLLRHLIYHGYLTKLKCIGQNVVFRNKLPPCALKENYEIAVPTNEYICEWRYCSFEFNTIYDFLLHVELHVRNNPSGKKPTDEEIRCEWNGCNIKLNTQYRLMEHVRVHTKEKTVACPNCVALFSNKTKFADHRNRQLKVNLRSYQCSQCLKLFPSERLLSDHMRSHINQYKCTMCDMTCAKPSILAKHFRYRHLNERPYECHCGKRFVAKCNLRTHMETHKEKPMKCELCEFGCKSKVGLDNHYTKVHRINKVKYQCHECNKYFNRGDYLTKHLIKQHKFHWPSGHARFRYRKDQDGVCRLQTVRYESLEVTDELIRSESMPPLSKLPPVTYNISYDKSEKNYYKLTIVQNDSESYKVVSEEELHRLRNYQPVNNNVIITIEDVDNDGNIVNTQVIKSNEIVIDGGPDVKGEKEEGEIIGINEDVRHFSKEVIMNSDNVNIKTERGN